MKENPENTAPSVPRPAARTMTRRTKTASLRSRSDSSIAWSPRVPPAGPPSFRTDWCHIGQSDRRLEPSDTARPLVESPARPGAVHAAAEETGFIVAIGGQGDRDGHPAAVPWGRNRRAAI